MALDTYPAGTKLSASQHRYMHGRLTEVRYAHPEGDNANDGMTWGTAKKDVVSAYDALSAAGGTIYCADGTAADSVTATNGLWIAGSLDPNYASLPAGWRQQKRLRLIGVPSNHAANTPGASQAAMSGGSASDRTKPVISVSGTDVPIQFKGVLVSAMRPVTIGISSSGTRDVNTSGVRFDECGIINSGVNGGGPGVDIGYCFWVWFDRCLIAGGHPVYALSAATITAGTTARFTTTLTHALAVDDVVVVSGVTPSAYNGTWTITAIGASTFDANIGSSPANGTVFGQARTIENDRVAAILAKPEGGLGVGVSAGFSVNECNFNGGGIRYYSGSTTWGFDAKGITQEVGFTDMGPLAHISMSHSGGRAHIEAVAQADASNQATTVKVRPITSDPSCVLVRAVDGAIPIDGPATLLGRASQGTMPPAVNGQVGIWASDRFAGIHDAHRRVFAPTAARFVNLASSNASTWSGLSGTATVTTGKNAPDGSSNAAELSTASSGDIYRRLHGGSLTLAVGDWLLAGTWARTVTAGVPTTQPLRIGTANPGNSFVGGGNVRSKAMPTSNGREWEWMWLALKFAAVDTTPGIVACDLVVEQNRPMEYFGPVFVQVPTSAGYTDEEITEYARHLSSYPDGASAGTVSTFHGQKLIARGGLGVGNSAAATTPGSVVRKMEVFSETGASLGFVPIYSSIT